MEQQQIQEVVDNNLRAEVYGYIAFYRDILRHAKSYKTFRGMVRSGLNNIETTTWMNSSAFPTILILLYYTSMCTMELIIARSVLVTPSLAC
jgi:hypothetical protein